MAPWRGVGVRTVTLVSSDWPGLTKDSFGTGADSPNGHQAGFTIILRDSCDDLVDLSAKADLVLTRPVAPERLTKIVASALQWRGSIRDLSINPGRENYRRLVSVLASESSTIDTVAGIISSDIGLSLHLLRLVPTFTERYSDSPAGFSDFVHRVGVQALARYFLDPRLDLMTEKTPDRWQRKVAHVLEVARNAQSYVNDESLSARTRLLAIVSHIHHFTAASATAEELLTLLCIHEDVIESVRALQRSTPWKDPVVTAVGSALIRSEKDHFHRRESRVLRLSRLAS